MFKLFIFVMAGFIAGAAWAHWQAVGPLNPSFIGAGIGFGLYAIQRTIAMFFSTSKKNEID